MDTSAVGFIKKFFLGYINLFVTTDSAVYGLGDGSTGNLCAGTVDTPNFTLIANLS